MFRRSDFPTFAVSFGASMIYMRGRLHLERYICAGSCNCFSCGFKMMAVGSNVEIGKNDGKVEMSSGI